MKAVVICFIMVISSIITIGKAQTSSANLGVSTAASYPELEAQQKLLDNTKIVYAGSSNVMPKPDSVRLLISRFYVDQFRHFQDPKAPYFMFMSKDAKVAMGVGGVIRMRGWVDWNGSIPANGFAPYLIPITKDPTNMKRLGATPSGCAVFLTLLGKKSILGEYTGYIEANFNGYRGVGFQLKKAYFMAGDWTLGYATSTFSDPSAQPPTIDGAGPNGYVSRTNILIRYMHTFKNVWSIAGSLEIPSPQIDDSGEFTKKCADWFPDISGFFQYEWTGGLSHLRLSGLMRVMSYRDLIMECNRDVVGWGVQLTGKCKIGYPLTVFGGVGYGKGVGSYLGDLSCDNTDLVPNPSKDGYLYAPGSLGFTLGLKYNFTSSVYSTLALGHLRYYPKSGIEESAYKYGMYGAINLFWDITPRFQIGAEYLAGKRMNIGGMHGNANRADALFQFMF